MDDRVSRRRLLSALGVLAAGGLAGCQTGRRGRRRDGTATPDGSGATPESTPQGTPREVDVDTPEPTEAPPSDSPYAGAYRAVIDSVTAVSVQTPGGPGSGTAWAYEDRTDGRYLVTNDHIVGDASSAAVRFRDGQWREAAIVGSDPYSDLGVVRVGEAPGEATPLGTVDREPAVGEEVIAVGNPFGLSGSVTAGIISGHDRALDAPNGFSIPDAVQTDAAANPGNSGGPLVTLEGDVAGVINSGVRGGDNIGFAISAALTDRVVPALIETGDYDHPFMGIGFREVDRALARANNLPVTWGIYVDDAVDGGPADGVLRGSTGSVTVDGRRVPTGGDVIVKLDDRVVQTQGDLGTYLALNTAPGDTLAVQVIRGDTKAAVDLTLGARPDP